MEQEHMIQKKIDNVAIMWNKTKNPKYEDEWYRLIKGWYGKDINNINITVRWNVSKREVRFGKTNGSTRMYDVCERS